MSSGDTLPRVLAVIFLFSAMFSVWMQATPDDLRSPLHSKSFLFRRVLAAFGLKGNKL